MIKRILKFLIKSIKLNSTPKILKTRGNVIVGRHTLYNGKINLSGVGKIIFGNYCAIGPNLTIISSNHNYNLPASQVSLYQRLFKTGYPGSVVKGPVVIGNDVWFGENVIVLCNVKIGDGACLGAGSIVTRDIPPYAIAAGVPARILKFRFEPKTIEYLLNLKWWDWPDDRIRRNEKFFMTDLTKVKTINLLKEMIVD